MYFNFLVSRRVTTTASSCLHHGYVEESLTLRTSTRPSRFPHRRAKTQPPDSWGGPADEVHNQGEVWCVTLHEVWAKPGQQVCWTSEMTHSPVGHRRIEPGPCQRHLPSKRRDGISSRPVTRWIDYVELWTAFAKRGMGFSATVPTAPPLLECPKLSTSRRTSPSARPTGFLS